MSNVTLCGYNEGQTFAQNSNYWRESGTTSWVKLSFQLF